MFSTHSEKTVSTGSEDIISALIRNGWAGKPRLP